MFLLFGMQLMRKKMVKGAKECIKLQATNTEIYGKMHAVFIEMDSSANAEHKHVIIIIVSAMHESVGHAIACIS